MELPRLRKDGAEVVAQSRLLEHRGEERDGVVLVLVLLLFGRARAGCQNLDGDPGPLGL